MKGYAQHLTAKHKTLDRVSFSPRDIRNTQANRIAVLDLRKTLDDNPVSAHRNKKNEAFTLQFNTKLKIFEAFTLQFNTWENQNPAKHPDIF